MRAAFRELPPARSGRERVEGSRVAVDPPFRAARRFSMQLETSGRGFMIESRAAEL
jgi:hypothetical protein